MKKTYLFSLLLLLTSLIGCYEDKGNYNYKDIEPIEITFKDRYLRLVYDAKVKFEPEISQDIEKNAQYYTFTWYVNDEVREEAHGAVFEWTVDRIFSNGHVVLEIKDSRNGMIYSKRVSIDVVGPYESDYSWMILSDNGGKSQLSYFACIEPDYETVENHVLFKETKFFENAYDGKELGTGPICLQEHFREARYPDQAIGNVLVFQNSGATDLNGQSFAKNVDIKDTFDGGIIPEGVIFHPASFVDYIDFISDQNGKLYKRVKKSNEVYNSEYFLINPLEYEDKVLEKCMVCRGYYKENRNGYIVVYDGGNKRLIYTKNATPGYDENWNDEDFIRDAGRMFEFPAGPTDADLSKFVPLNNFNGYQVLALEMYQIPSNRSNTYGVFILLKEEATSQLFIQKVKLEGSGGEPEVKEVTKYALSGIPSLPSLFAFPIYSPQTYVFFAIGNKLYIKDLENENEAAYEYYQFESPISAINCKSRGNSHLAVGLEDGSFFILDMIGAKNLEMEKRVLYQAPQKVGRIVDVQYKQVDIWNY